MTTHFPPSQGYGGVCESSWGLANGLVDAGVVVHVISSDASIDGRIAPERFRELERPGLHIHTYRYALAKKHAFAFNSMRTIKAFAEKCDVVHANGIMTHPVHQAALAARRLGRPYVVSLRNGLDPWLLQFRKFRKLIAFHLYVKRDVGAASAVHLTSELELQGARNFGVHGPFTVVPNGLASEAAADEPNPALADAAWPVLKGRKVVLFLSRLSPQKGLDMLIGAWDRITDQHPEAMLVIAGPDYEGYERNVRQWVSTRKSPSSVLLTGLVVGELKWSLYARASFFVLPSYTENFGNVVTEALAAGTPVIASQATPWSVLRERDLGAWIPVDADVLSHAMLEFLDKPDDVLKAMGSRGREYVATELTWRMAGQKMKLIYESILAGHQVPFQPSVDTPT